MCAWTAESISRIDWSKGNGLVPAIVQHADDGRMLMLGYMDRAGLETTLSSGHVTFFSRSRRCSWTKGETSGHFLEAISIAADCDGDALLVQARPLGPTCHRGTATCFSGTIAALEVVIAKRRNAISETSYTRELLDAGVKRVAQKVGEEAVETALAAVAGDDAQFLGEAADLMYHLLVLLHVRRLALSDLEAVLMARMKA